MDRSHAIFQKIFSLPRTLGAFPFDEKFVFSKKLFIYSLVIRMVSVAGIVDAFIYEPYYTEDVRRSNAMKTTIGYAWAIVNVINCTIPMIFWLCKRKTLSELMKVIDEILIKCPKIKYENRRFKQTSFLLFSYSLYAIIYTFMFNFHSFRFNLREYINKFVTSCFTIGFVGQFCDLMDFLSSVFRECIDFDYGTAVEIYETLSTSYEIMNDIYNPQILITVIIFFFACVIHLYVIMLPLYPITSPSSILLLLWLLLIFIPIVTMTQSCNRVQHEAKIFNEHLYRKMAEDKTYQLLGNEKLDFHFIAKDDTIFTACGFFTLDNTLFCSMISTATTYLVIVLQYSKVNEPNTEYPFNTTLIDYQSTNTT